MSNNTGGAGSAVYSYIAYIAEGAVIGPANLLVAMSILRYEALRSRKEYIILMALSLADAINILAYVLAGWTRLGLHFERRANEMVPSRHCLKQPYVLLWSFADQNAQLMLVVVSVDRLLSVAVPLRYIKFSRSYATLLVTGAFGLTLCAGLVSCYLSYHQPQTELISIICFGVDVYGQSPLSAYYYVNMPQLWAMSSVFIFGLVLPVYKYQKGKHNAGENEEQKMNAQRKVTKSMAISCLCTLCLYLVPYRLAHYVYGRGLIMLAYGLWAFTLNNSLANVIIYELRHRELLVALKSLMVCKEQPAVLSLWNLGNRTAVRSRQKVNRVSARKEVEI